MTFVRIFVLISSRMQYLLPLLLVVLTIQTSTAPPVTQQKKDGEHKDNENEVEEIEEVGYFENNVIDLFNFYC